MQVDNEPTTSGWLTNVSAVDEARQIADESGEPQGD